MGHTVDLEWPGLAEALKTYECREVRPPRYGEKYLSLDGEVCVSNVNCIDSCIRPILVPKWTYPTSLPGSVCIARDANGDFYVFTERPTYGDGDWFEGGEDCARIHHIWETVLGITLPPSTGDPSRDIWFNPAHPANQERSDD